MKKKLNLERISIQSFVTAIDPKEIVGASGCCLNESGPGENNCITWGHASDCGSTGNTDDPTGRNMNTMMFCSQTQGTESGC